MNRNKCPTLLSVQMWKTGLGVAWNWEPAPLTPRAQQEAAPPSAPKQQVGAVDLAADLEARRKERSQLRSRLTESRANRGSPSTPSLRESLPVTVCLAAWAMVRFRYLESGQHLVAPE